MLFTLIANPLQLEGKDHLEIPGLIYKDSSSCRPITFAIKLMLWTCRGRQQWPLSLEVLLPLLKSPIKAKC